MRAISYTLCVIVVGLPAVFSAIAPLLSLLLFHVPYSPMLGLVFSFGSLVPPMLMGLVPRILAIGLSYVMAFLVLRRIWLFIAKKERVPASYVGFQRTIGYIGVCSFGLGLLALTISIKFKAGSGVPAGLLMIPAMFCVPWAFFLTEVISFRKKALSNAV